MEKRDLDNLEMAFIMGERERNPRLEHLDTLTQPEELADYLKAEREALMVRLRLPGNEAEKGLAISRKFSDLMDAVMTRMFALACARAGAKEGSLPIVIVATGGYGRRELSPHSDIDITFIPQRDGDPLVDAIIRDMFTQVMDICISRCGLEVGYAYRLMEDCDSLDHQTACGLLDARVITGSDRLFIQFEDAFWLGFNAADFIFTKLGEREASLRKWGRAPRVVEPQLKEGPGGLRDLQTAVWLAQAKSHLAAARARGERSIETLKKEAGVTPDEAARLAEAKEFLLRVRNTLHALTGAERDQLVITRQEAVAAALGYEERPDDPETPPVERFMGDLFPHLAQIRRAADQIMRGVGNSRLILGIGLDCEQRRIVPANEALETDDPGWLLWACELAQKYDLELGEGLERAAAALVERQPLLPDQDSSAQVFTGILARTGKVYCILQKMADLGTLGWYLPEFGALMDLIPYDPSHEYTIGQHTLFVLHHLEQLLQAEGPEERIEMRRILEELPDPEQLMLAVLLHDAGKTDHSRPHSETGEEIAQRVCLRLGWTEEAASNVRFLVRQHLLMAETSRLRDLNLDETIRDFTAVVSDVDRLNMLYLLTYADTRAVGEGVWTQVKGKFLRDLWRRALAVLSEEEPLGYDEAMLARARRRLQKDLSLENLPEAEVTEHIRAMPPEYLLNQRLDQIALDIGGIRRVRESGQPVIEFHDERDATFTELTVCTYDDPEPGLLAKIAGVLYAANLDIHSVQALTRVTARDRIALDTLWVDYRGRQLSPGKRREVATHLTETLTGAQSVRELLSKRKTARGNGATLASEQKRIEVREVATALAEGLTFVETSGPDVSGVLYRVCDALSRLGWDIRSARASPWHGEGRVSVYVTGAQRLSESEVRSALAKVLRSWEEFQEPLPPLTP